MRAKALCWMALLRAEPLPTPACARFAGVADLVCHRNVIANRAPKAHFVHQGRDNGHSQGIGRKANDLESSSVLRRPAIAARALMAQVEDLSLRAMRAIRA